MVIDVSPSVATALKPGPGTIGWLGLGLGLGTLPAPTLPHAVRMRPATAAINAALTMNTQRAGLRRGNT